MKSISSSFLSSSVPYFLTIFYVYIFLLSFFLASLFLILSFFICPWLSFYQSMFLLFIWFLLSFRASFFFFLSSSSSSSTSSLAAKILRQSILKLFCHFFLLKDIHDDDDNIDYAAERMKVVSRRCFFASQTVSISGRESGHVISSHAKSSNPSQNDAQSILKVKISVYHRRWGSRLYMNLCYNK